MTHLRSRRSHVPFSPHTAGLNRKPGRHTLRPRLEGLEDRTLLSSADLSITITGPANVTAGTDDVYSITITNNGPDAAQNVLFQNVCSPEGRLVSLSGSGFTFTFTSDQTFSATKATMAPGEVDSFLADFLFFPSDAAGSIFSDSASVVSSTPDPVAANNFAAFASNVQTSADLSVVKTGPSTVVPGTSATYTITIHNAGPSDGVAFDFSDAAPGGTTQQTLQQLSGPPLDQPLPPNSTVVLQEVDTLAPDIPNGTTESTIVVLLGSTPDPNGANNSSTVTSTATTVADMAVTMTGPATAVAGDELTYTVTLKNNGPSDAFGVGFSFGATSSPGAVAGLSIQQVSGTDPFGLAPTPGVLSDLSPIAPGTSDVFRIVVQTDPSAADGSIVTTAVDVGGPGSLSDPNAANNHAEVTTTLQTQADLAVTNTVSPNPVLLGGNITYTLAMTNNGPSVAQHATLLDSLPAGTVFVSETQTSGPVANCTDPAAGAGGMVACAIPTLDSAASASFVLVVREQSRALDGATVENTASVSSGTSDPNTANNSATTLAQVFGHADLALTKSGPASVISGNNLTYTLTLTNNGPIFDPDVVLQDAMPANTTFVSETQTNGPAFTAHTPAVGGTGLISCDLDSLAAGASACFQIVVHVNFNAPNRGVIVNTATASGGLQDPNLANNTATVRTVAITPTADLAITGSATPTTLKAGGSGALIYTLTVTNVGPDPAQNVSVVDALPSQVGFAGETHPAGWSSLDPPLGSHNNVVFQVDSLAAGASVTFTIVIKAPGLPVGVSLLDTATITSATFDPSLLNNTIVIITHVR